MARASSSVSVWPVCAPRRTPPCVTRAGQHQHDVRAQALDLLLDALLRAAADRDHRDHRGHADDDAEHRQDAAQQVGGQRAPGASAARRARSCRGLAPAAGRTRRLRARPRRCGRRGRRCAAPPRRRCRCSCVTMTTVMPCAFSSVSSRMMSSRGLRVERAGRLVGQDQLRPVDQRARDRHALLLAAGQLGRRVAGALGQARRAPAPRSARSCALGRLDAGIDHRQLDVLQRAGARQQVELLEHEADAAVADRRQRVAAPAPRPPRRPAGSCPASAGRGSRGCSSACSCPSPRRP